MRYIVVSLIIVNLAYFAWNWLSPETPPPQARLSPLSNDIAPVVLLAERDADPVHQAVSSPAAQAERSLVPTPLPPIREMSDSGFASEPEASIEPEDRPSPAPHVQTVAAVEVPAARTCETVGPISSDKLAKELASLLASHSYEVDKRSDQLREPAGYWVFLPSMERAAARSVVADLDAHGMTDYYVGKQNYISLGIFSDEVKAAARQHVVQQIGYDPVVEQRFRTRNVVWLNVGSQAKALAGSALAKEILAQHANLQIKEAACE
jgi:hypothetical protein